MLIKPSTKSSQHKFGPLQIFKNLHRVSLRTSAEKQMGEDEWAIYKNVYVTSIICIYGHIHEHYDCAY